MKRLTISHCLIATLLIIAGCGTGGTGSVLDCFTNADCNDGNICTTDMCVSGTCRFVPLGTCGPQPAIGVDADAMRAGHVPVD